MGTSRFALPFEVRDYECDLQGIVNNAVYQQYLEHARHQFIKSRGLDFAELTARGIHLVVVRAEIDYKCPLRSGDGFVVELALERLSPVRCKFRQDIHRLPDKKLILNAAFVCAAMDGRGKPMLLKAVDALFSDGAG